MATITTPVSPQFPPQSADAGEATPAAISTLDTLHELRKNLYGILSGGPDMVGELQQLRREENARLKW